MRKTLLLSFTLLCLAAFAGAALAAESVPQIYPKAGYLVMEKEKIGGAGEGVIHCEYAFPRDKATAEQAIKEIAWLTLPPGASISFHAHKANEDAYIIISGEGTFTGTDGKAVLVKAGDTTIARRGQSHSLKNTGKEPLLILDVIAQQ
jgi:mannose-6-phosphate isomerase-like protein (cupin superfamily)